MKKIDKKAYQESVYKTLELNFDGKFVGTGGHFYIRPKSNFQKFSQKEENQIEISVKKHGLKCTKKGVKWSGGYMQETIISDGMGFRLYIKNQDVYLNSEFFNKVFNQGVII